MPIAAVVVQDIFSLFFAIAAGFLDAPYHFPNPAISFFFMKDFPSDISLQVSASESFVHVCRNVCLSVCTGTHVYICVWKLDINSRYLLQSFFILQFETRSVTNPGID